MRETDHPALVRMMDGSKLEKFIDRLVEFHSFFNCSRTESREWCSTLAFRKKSYRIIDDISSGEIQVSNRAIIAAKWIKRNTVGNCKWTREITTDWEAAKGKWKLKYQDVRKVRIEYRVLCHRLGCMWNHNRLRWVANGKYTVDGSSRGTPRVTASNGEWLSRIIVISRRPRLLKLLMVTPFGTQCMNLNDSLEL